MKRYPVASSSLRAVGYDPQHQVLEVEFHDGHVYRYEQVPAQLVSNLLAADSLGGYFNRVFKPCGFPYRQVA